MSDLIDKNNKLRQKMTNFKNVISSITKILHKTNSDPSNLITSFSLDIK